MWFGEESVDRVVRWLSKNEDLVPKIAHILDLGCGNGKSCFELACEGYDNVIGVDYCSEAIELSRKIAEKHDVTNVKFQTCDILTDIDSLRSDIGRQTFDVCMDKGTYDAVSLNPDNPKEKREKYIQNVALLLEKQGFLIITSCNWTEEELKTQFSKSKFIHPSLCSLIKIISCYLTIF